MSESEAPVLKEVDMVDATAVLAPVDAPAEDSTTVKIEDASTGETSTDAKKEEDDKTEKITDDGGVVKRIIKEGTGWERPRKGTEVFVHYVGRLTDGTVFDSSRERNEPFKFKLGMGQVIKGWDKGVKEMKKGEVAILTIKPEYGYGKAGSPPKIPGDSTLEFEVELLYWQDEEDISETKDGSLIKKTLTEGDGWDKPKDDSVVEIHYILSLENGTVIEDTKTKGEPFKFRVGDDSIPEGLEKAVESMKKKERSLFTIQSKHCYGETGCPERNIPANATLKYEIEMLDWVKAKNAWDLNFEEKLETATRRKNEGNELYRQKRLTRAIKKYKKALSFFDSEYNLKEEEKKKAKEFKLPCYLNVAACALQQKGYKEVVENCTKALDIDRQNLKGLLRRAHARIMMDEWDLASRDLERAKDVSPNDKDVLRELELLKRKVAEQNRRDKKKFAGLFDKIREMDFKIPETTSTTAATQEAKKQQDQQTAPPSEQPAPMEIAAN